jgi:hypothetical protein
MVLAAVVFGLGLLMAVPVALVSEAPKERDGDLGNFEAMQHARQPVWVALLNPVVGAGGVFLGSRLRKPEGAR